MICDAIVTIYEIYLTHIENYYSQYKFKLLLVLLKKKEIIIVLITYMYAKIGSFKARFLR